MFTNSILDSLAMFGYVVGFLSICLCILAYFAIPKLIKMIFENEEEAKNE